MGFAYEQSVGRVIVAYVIFGYTVAVQVISEADRGDIPSASLLLDVSPRKIHINYKVLKFCVVFA